MVCLPPVPRDINEIGRKNLLVFVLVLKTSFLDHSAYN